MPVENLSNVLAPHPKRSLAEDIVDHLREAIYSGHLAPNERLREEVLASVLGLSRGPVREALAQLEREGLVIREPHRGATVARLSLEDLDEVHSLRLALEQLAVKQAIRTADDHYFDEMQKVIDEMGAAVARGINTQEAAELDTRFHELICEASGHKRLLNMWLMLRPQIHIFLLSRNVVNADFSKYIVTDHLRILNILRSRDEQHALEAIEEHLKGAYERILKSYSTQVQDSANGSTAKKPKVRDAKRGDENAG
jgi:DNA-binding GntR family transcriptional regulator